MFMSVVMAILTETRHVQKQVMFMSVVVTILTETSHVHVCCGDDTVRDKSCSCLSW